MSLEWDVLGWLACVQGLALIVVTMPSRLSMGGRPNKMMVKALNYMLQPLMVVVPFCFYLLLDIMWKYEHQPSCQRAAECDAVDHLRRKAWILRCQRNLVLVLVTLHSYWILYCVARLLTQLELLKDKLKRPTSAIVAPPQGLLSQMH